MFVNVTLWNMDATEEVQYSEEEVQFRGSAVQRKCSAEEVQYSGWLEEERWDYRERDGILS